MDGGPALTRQGLRAVPSLMYLERQPNFSIGPDESENENAGIAASALRAVGATRSRKTAQSTAQSARNLVPQGGLFWDGRADTLQSQAFAPLLNPAEMDAGSIDRVAVTLKRAPYAPQLRRLFGAAIDRQPRLLVAEALFAVARFEFEDASFHPYTSKFDYWLEGKARLSPAESRGYALFNDQHGADCAACHVDRVGADRLPPLLTDHQFEALAAPRNRALIADRDDRFFDLGLCGPVRSDLRTLTRYCGMFATPTLRNVALRHAFFHNGVYRSLRQVLEFYNFRAVDPARVYPRTSGGVLAIDDDLPVRYRANVDVSDPPFDRARAARPPMSARDEDDIIAFLRTLTDGYALAPPARDAPRSAGDGRASSRAGLRRAASRSRR